MIKNLKSQNKRKIINIFDFKTRTQWVEEKNLKSQNKRKVLRILSFIHSSQLFDFFLKERY